MEEGKSGRAVNRNAGRGIAVASGSLSHGINYRTRYALV